MTPLVNQRSCLMRVALRNVVPSALRSNAILLSRFKALGYDLNIFVAEYFKSEPLRFPDCFTPTL